MENVDLYIDSDATWEIDLQFWENSDRTNPIDITSSTFEGAFTFGKKCIGITFQTGSPDVNVLNCRVDAYQLKSLPPRGTYVITATNNGDKTRVLQGNVVVDRGQSCS